MDFENGKYVAKALSKFLTTGKHQQIQMKIYEIKLAAMRICNFWYMSLLKWLWPTHQQGVTQEQRGSRQQGETWIDSKKTPKNQQQNQTRFQLKKKESIRVEDKGEVMHSLYEVWVNTVNLLTNGLRGKVELSTIISFYKTREWVVGVSPTNIWPAVGTRTQDREYTELDHCSPELRPQRSHQSLQHMDHLPCTECGWGWIRWTKYLFIFHRQVSRTELFWFYCVILTFVKMYFL